MNIVYPIFFASTHLISTGQKTDTSCDYSTYLDWMLRQHWLSFYNHLLRLWLIKVLKASLQEFHVRLQTINKWDSQSWNAIGTVPYRSISWDWLGQDVGFTLYASYHCVGKGIDCLIKKRLHRWWGSKPWIFMLTFRIRKGVVLWW